MELIPFFEKALLVAAAIFIVVLIISFIYSKIKKEQVEEPTPPETDDNQTKSTVQKKKMARTYTASSTSQKLYVNTDQHRKYVKQSKLANKSKRFTIVNNNGNKEED